MESGGSFRLRTALCRVGRAGGQVAPTPEAAAKSAIALGSPRSY
jgi:hypothetical protein